MPRLGVLGWPVAHSRSPAMHNAALARARDGAAGATSACPCHPSCSTRPCERSAAPAFAGANVTIPHKRAALALADRASDAARAIGAANTLTFDPDGSIAAENTDAPGLIAALGEPPRGLSAHDPRSRRQRARRGRGRCARRAPRDVAVWNRTPERAAELARELGVRAVSRPAAADLLVNCTSVGLGLEPSASDDQALNQLALTFDQVGEYPYVVDMVYRTEPTPLLAAAREHGSRTLDGLEILVAQGALSFELWTGRRPPLEVMRSAARAGLEG